MAQEWRDSFDSGDRCWGVVLSYPACAEIKVNEDFCKCTNAHTHIEQSSHTLIFTFCTVCKCRRVLRRKQIFTPHSCTKKPSSNLMLYVKNSGTLLCFVRRNFLVRQKHLPAQSHAQSHFFAHSRTANSKISRLLWNMRKLHETVNWLRSASPSIYLQQHNGNASNEHSEGTTYFLFWKVLGKSLWTYFCFVSSKAGCKMSL